MISSRAGVARPLTQGWRAARSAVPMRSSLCRWSRPKKRRVVETDGVLAPCSCRLRWAMHFWTMIALDPAAPKGIVWIASYPKSGNTWVRAFIYALYHTIVGSPELRDEIDIEALNHMVPDERYNRMFHERFGRSLREVDQREIAAFRPEVQAETARRFGRPIFLKTHNARVEDDGWPVINPDVSAGAIYVIRNPLDVAVSFAAFRDAPIDVVIDDMQEDDFILLVGDSRIHDIVASWSEHVASWTVPTDQTVLVVRYEDMLSQPEPTFAAIARHVMMPHTRQQLLKAIDLTRFDRLQKAEQRTGFSDKPPDADRFFRQGRAGGWREVLTGAQVQRITDAHHEQMRRFGY